MAHVTQISRRAVACGGIFFAGRAGAAATPKLQVVTILGDSITAGLGLPAVDALPAQLQIALGRIGVSAIVRGAGVSGDTTAGALARTDFSVQDDTAVCVVELGGNDFLQGARPAEIESNLRAIIAKLKRRRFGVVLATARAPSGGLGDYGREFAALFPRVGRDTGAALTPNLLAGLGRNLKQRDDLHPSAAGVRLLAERIAPTVATALRRRRRAAAP